LRDRITPKSWKKVTNDDAMPRGGTPLNDATGMMLDLAERGGTMGYQVRQGFPLLLSLMEENASQEYRGSEGAQKIKFRLNALGNAAAVTILVPTSTTRSRQLPMVHAIWQRCRHLLRILPYDAVPWVVSVVSTLRVRVICHGPHMNKAWRISDQNIVGGYSDTSDQTESA